MNKEEFMNLLVQNNELEKFLEYITSPENIDKKIVFDSIISFSEDNQLFNVFKEKISDLNLVSFKKNRKTYKYLFSKEVYTNISSILNFLASTGYDGHVTNSDDTNFHVLIYDSKLENQIGIVEIADK